MIDVKATYDAQDKEYDRYSQHTAGEVAKGVEKGKYLEKLAVALRLKNLEISTVQIAEATGLSIAEIYNIKNENEDS